MERTMSVEEKIKRAEEIYARRHENEGISNMQVHLHGKEKKDIKLFKKLILQIVVCLLIYLIIYTIRNNNFIFTDDFLHKTKEILSYDVNFNELYNNLNNEISQFFKTSDVNTINNENNIGGSEETSWEPNQELSKSNGEIQEQNNINNVNVKENNEEAKDEVKEVKKEEVEENKVEKPELSDEEKTIMQIKNTTSFIKPVEGFISSKYGLRNPTTSTVPKNHTGTDIAASTGTKIKSATDGEVVQVSSQGDYGNHVKIKIGDVSILYAHCNKIYVSEGEKVRQGQEIAEVGSTGNSTGPHLHFEIRLYENTIDPEKILEL